ncbi:MAG: ABC transporter substrate-binding protein [Alphaproteobacteria bacterium]|nr:ABC transporter substrate-binding protein [Alphaproteobacteria bacterium]
MKKVLIGLFIALCLLVVGYNAYQSERQATTGKTKVYAVLPLSGVYAQYGKDVKSIIEWYIQNKKPNFEIVYMDSEGEPAKGVTAFQQRAIYAKEPIVFSVFSPISAVMTPVVKEKGGFLFSISTVGIASDLGNYQIISRSSSDIIDILLPYIQKNFKNIAIIHSDDEYGHQETKLMKSQFSGKIYEETFNPRNPDVRIEVLKLIDVNPEAIVVLGSTTPAYINIFKELKSHEYKGQILSDSGFTNPHIFNVIGDATEGVISTAMLAETTLPQSEQIQQLQEAFQKDNKKLYYIMLEAFETLEIINYTLNNNLSFTQETYQNMGRWKGVSGDILFLKDGKCSIKSYVLIKVKDGQIVPLEE